MSGDTEHPSSQIESSEPKITQLNHVTSPFIEAGFPIIGDVNDNYQFEPFKAELIGENDLKSDPMFEIFADFENNPSNIRWHLPPDIAKQKQLELIQGDQVEQTITLTVKEFENEIKSATEKGASEGFISAQNQFEEKLTESSRRILDIFEQLKEQIDASIEMMQRKAVKLSVDLAGQILNQKINEDPYYLIPVIREAFGLVSDSKIFSVKVSPHDFEFLDKSQLLEKLGQQQDTWEFLPDSNIEAGCIVETTAGQIEIDLLSSFSQLKNILLEEDEQSS
jgi:flagellar biosynthesis/type III secretory pathway protein FliH